MERFKGVVQLKIADIVIFIEGIPQSFNLNLLKNKKVICQESCFILKTGKH